MVVGVGHPLIVLQDLGMSAHLGGGASHLSNHPGGTPYWMAPEVAASGHVSPAADMYSFGVLIWTCFTGQKPSVTVPGEGTMRNPHFPTYHHAVHRAPPETVLELQTM